MVCYITTCGTCGGGGCSTLPVDKKHAVQQRTQENTKIRICGTYIYIYIWNILKI